MARSVRIVSVNVNGIRAAVRKGMTEWLDASGADIVTLQEVRATAEQLAEALPGWRIVNDEALQKGRAGVAIISRLPGIATRTHLGPEPLDASGRWIETDFDIDGETVTIVSAYVHSGEVDTPKQDAKWVFLDAMEQRLADLASERELALVTGDLNVGHRELDIKNWRGNRKKAGFLAEERAYFDAFFAEEGAAAPTVDGSERTGLGWVDVGRRHAGEVEGPYTWWSNRGQAYVNNVGWRLDYQLASPSLAAAARAASIYKDVKFSDHAPLTIDYDFNL